MSMICVYCLSIVRLDPLTQMWQEKIHQIAFPNKRNKQNRCLQFGSRSGLAWVITSRDSYLNLRLVKRLRYGLEVKVDGVGSGATGSRFSFSCSVRWLLRCWVNSCNHHVSVHVTVDIKKQIKLGLLFRFYDLVGGHWYLEQVLLQLCDRIRKCALLW